METGEHHAADVLFFFDGKPRELALYRALEAAMAAAFPLASVKVQKSQISFYSRHLFAAASLPLRWRKDWPDHCLLVTFGLGEPLSSPRIAVVTEPYPGRWTHHAAVAREEEIDGTLMGWLAAAHAFAETKSRRRKGGAHGD